MKLRVGSNKSIVGLGADAALAHIGFDVTGWGDAETGTLADFCEPEFEGQFDPVSNVIIRNLTFRDTLGGSSDADAVANHRGRFVASFTNHGTSPAAQITTPALGRKSVRSARRMPVGSSTLATGATELGIRPKMLEELKGSPNLPLAGGATPSLVWTSSGPSVSSSRRRTGCSGLGGAGVRPPRGRRVGRVRRPRRGRRVRLRPPNRLMSWHLHMRGDPRRDALVDGLLDSLGETPPM